MKLFFSVMTLMVVTLLPIVSNAQNLVITEAAGGSQIWADDVGPALTPDCAFVSLNVSMPNHDLSSDEVYITFYVFEDGVHQGIYNDSDLGITDEGDTFGCPVWLATDKDPATDNERTIQLVAIAFEEVEGPGGLIQHVVVGQTTISIDVTNH